MWNLLVSGLVLGAAFVGNKRSLRRRPTRKIKSVQVGRNYVEVGKDDVKYIRFNKDEKDKIDTRGFSVEYNNGDVAILRNQAGSKVVFTKEIENIYAYDSIWDKTEK
ncbi:hypothetical protein [Carboxylicivirga sp. RSCT41]|uniref:hypothetical protein n=1 Tax=Carboxylicivirga agarovorans TaxID=3417570 RepID=UPI003D3408B2